MKSFQSYIGFRSKNQAKLQDFLPTVHRLSFAVTGLVGLATDSDELLVGVCDALDCDNERSRVSFRMSSSETLRSENDGVTEVSRISVNLELDGILNCCCI